MTKDYTEKCRFCPEKFGGERASINLNLHEKKKHPEKFEASDKKQRRSYRGRPKKAGGESFFYRSFMFYENY
jgi:hypothetical protein